MMPSLLKALIGGMGGAVNFPASPLYRYPYRSSAEALRSDWLKIGRDIENALEKGDEE